ncbi:MAG TPA: (d)CMP kinase [Flavitalea sp.]|nr:(d)CMP kinase [Flavitalea sp.]
MRDYIDSNREESPLRKADDAILVDNTNLTANETRQKVLKLTKKIINA